MILFVSWENERLLENFTGETKILWFKVVAVFCCYFYICEFYLLFWLFVVLQHKMLFVCEFFSSIFFFILWVCADDHDLQRVVDLILFDNLILFIYLILYCYLKKKLSLFYGVDIWNLKLETSCTAEGHCLFVCLVGWLEMLLLKRNWIFDLLYIFLFVCYKLKFWLWKNLIVRHEEWVDYTFWTEAYSYGLNRSFSVFGTQKLTFLLKLLITVLYWKIFSYFLFYDIKYFLLL